MKKLLLLALAACLPFSMAVAQMNPANYHIWYGTSDGAALSVGIDRDIEVPAFGQTDPANQADSVGFMHNPLGSADLYVTGRAGGFFPPVEVGLWDDKSFLPPNVFAGGTNQSMLGFHNLTDPYVSADLFFADGAPELICTFRMHTANDPGLIGMTVDALLEGVHPINGTHLWGNQNGSQGCAPTQHYAQFFFSPNSDPVLEAGPQTVDCAITCFDVTATDADPENILTVTGPDGFTMTGPSPLTGTFCGVGSASFEFTVDDGAGGVGTLTVVGAAADLGLQLECTSGFPGENVQVDVILHAATLTAGGFEILISYDPTALSLIPSATVWTSRIDGGNEYHNQILNPNGAGTLRLVWISDINNGVYHAPAAVGSDPVVTLTFAIDPGLPFGMNIPVTFLEIDYTDNTVSDETGYEFYQPCLTNGCVNTADPADFKGDPNMNCYGYEIADAVLVAQRLILSYAAVWPMDDAYPNYPPCDRHFAGNDDVQEAASDLNDNGFCDVADLVRFINIINGFIFPKLDPASGNVNVSINNGAVMINSGIDVGAVLVRIEGEISNPVANGMDMQIHTESGVTSVLVYSLVGNRIAAGNSTVFTFEGSGEIVEVAAADAFGRLLNASARPVAPIPTEFGVSQNYPNPFNAKTMINFGITTSSDVTINIYNITGQVVETINGHYEAGYHSINWDAANVSSGVYFAKVTSGEGSQTVKMTLLK